MAVTVAPDFSVYRLVDQIAQTSTLLKHRRVMSYVSYEIEKALISGKASGRLFSGFQRMSKFIPQMERYKKLAPHAEHVYVFGIPDVDLPEIDNITYIPVKPTDQLSKEWFAVLHGADYYTALVTEELTDIEDPDDTRVFRGVWTFDLDIVVALEKLLTRVAGAPTLSLHDSEYNHRQQIEIMNTSVGNLINRSNLGSPNMAKTQPILAGELKTEVKNNLMPKLREFNKDVPSDVNLKLQDVVILFSDIRDFTKISESMSPPDLVRKIVNPYLEVASHAIVKHHGTVDKFLGDGILAVFGIDNDEPAQTQEALAAALEMLQSFAAHNLNIEVGIGITRGQAFVDTIGSDNYSEKTVIGDVVNVAQRLSDFGRNEILLSSTAAESLSLPDNIIRYGEIELKGKSEPQLVFKYTTA